MLMQETTKRVEQLIRDLSRFNETPEKGITRRFLTSIDQEAKHYLIQHAQEQGLTVKEDAIGNIFCTLPGSNPDLPAVWTGSHVDAPLHGGMFDGVVGVVGALEALRLIREQDIARERNIIAVIFASEEPTRFGVGCLGSRALIGQLSETMLDDLVDQDGISLRQALIQQGRNPGAAVNSPADPKHIHKFVELHIEQGIVLEKLEKQIGIVTAIAAPADIRLQLYGVQGHAGATPMNLRKDAFAALGEISMALERLARQWNCVGTIGSVEVDPGTSNVIPGLVTCSIDIRGVETESFHSMLEKLHQEITNICSGRGIQFNWTLLSKDDPVQTDTKIVQSIESQCRTLGLSYHHMPSGAYHDSMIMAAISQVGMIFVPSRDGISHDHREWTNFEAIASGISVLTQTLIQLSQK
ncbi:M20 family metallo-hydrolase [Desmospora activa]|uniref:Allantoate deiminase/N-carbamoyl-L-amino-acid hydrolase n=1 Tax=Desmospora activa DSM 45169 TaxID=1121389 RepID=A0A2T4ZBU9_9BACL|nr:M20 family metallo-hydrolase [Desmospora activa]PTM59342.1 allantoate deiminase/N-carbamoyl-L-amino-acid hydrolase [Desmospora activa DSM 45169]